MGRGGEDEGRRRLARLGVANDSWANLLHPLRPLPLCDD